jgi:hypothetical protein
MTRSRKQCTSGDRCEPRNLQEAIYCELHHSDLPLARIAETIGVRAGYLMDAANPDRDDTQFQARLIAPTTRITGNTAVISLLSRECGGVFVPTPEVSADHSDIANHTAAILREVADVIQSPAKALSSNNDINASECADIERDIDEAVTALLSLKRLVRAKAGLDVSPLRAVEKGA